MANLHQSQSGGAYKASHINWEMSMPDLGGIALIINAAQGTLSMKIMHGMVTKAMAVGEKILKAEIKARLPLYKDGTRSNGQPFRWQTPTGALQNSIGDKVVSGNKMRNKDVVYGVVGPRTSFRVNKPVAARIEKMTTLGIIPGTHGSPKRAPKKIFIPKGPKGATVSPVKYAHLVERGHGAPVVSKPHPFMAPAMAKWKPKIRGIVVEAFPKRFMVVIGSEIKKLQNRANKKTGTI